MFNMTAFISTLIFIFALLTMGLGGSLILLNRYWGAKMIGLVVLIISSATLVSHITALLVR